MRQYVRALVLGGVILLSVVFSAPGSASGTSLAESAVEAKSGPLDWGDNEACMVWPDLLTAPECFPSERELDDRVAELEATIGQSRANCSGYLRLYDGTSYSGQTLYLRGRLQWFNLSSYSFSNKTSSFKIGPCSSYLADGSSGGGSWYPTGSTQAYDVAASMTTGWNNRVSSIYIT